MIEAFLAGVGAVLVIVAAWFRYRMKQTEQELERQRQKTYDAYLRAHRAQEHAAEAGYEQVQRDVEKARNGDRNHFEH